MNVHCETDGTSDRLQVLSMKQAAAFFSSVLRCITDRWRTFRTHLCILLPPEATLWKKFSHKTLNKTL